jgi:hypothetical protein
VLYKFKKTNRFLYSGPKKPLDEYEDYYDDEDEEESNFINR